MNRNARSEKEEVYRSLELLTRRCAAQRREINLLKEKSTAKEAVIARREATEYRKALSNIAYRLEQGPVAEDDLRSIVTSALLLRGIKGTQRAEIEARREAA